MTSTRFIMSIEVLIVSAFLLQVSLSAVGEEHEQLCGGPPNVTLSCTNGTAYVDWVASKPGCQFDCKAYWICTGPNVTHTEESSDYEYNTNGWDFTIPPNYQLCEVTVFYKYFSLDSFRNARSPETIKSCS